MIDYKALKVRPHDRIEVAFRKVVRYMVPDATADVIAKVARLVMKDNEYRPRVLRVIMEALENE